MGAPIATGTPGLRYAIGGKHAAVVRSVRPLARTAAPRANVACTNVAWRPDARCPPSGNSCSPLHHPNHGRSILMMREWRLATWIATLALGLLGWPVTARASHTFSDCFVTCEVDCDDPGSGPNCHEAEGGECILSADITCNSTTTPVVRLRDGMNLDMDGHTITCDASGGCHNGVQIEGNGSKVYNSAAPQEAAIKGGFWAGVECNLYPGSEVDGIRIENTLIGLRNCKIVKNNAIVGLGRTYLTANWGIQTQGVTSGSDLISGNYFADKNRAILITGTNAVEARDNVIHTTGWSACGVELTTGSQAVLKGNTFLGVGNAGFGTTRKVICVPTPEPTGVTYSGNVCDRDHPDCAACIAAGRCMPFTAPFVR
jgi:hypothetical protein